MDDPTPRPARPDALLVLVAVLVVYALTPWGSWHYDDGHHVADNTSIRSLANVPRFFTDSNTFSALPHHRLYRPVLMTSFALDWAVWGPRVHGFLISNVLVHALAALAVLALARTMLGRNRAALIAGLLFGIHPLGSEVVNYVSSRSSSLATLFAVLSILAFLRAEDSRRGESVSWWLLSYALFAAGLFTKEIVVTLPILALIASSCRTTGVGRPRPLWRRALPVLPMIAIGCVWFWLINVQVGAIVGSLEGRITQSIGGDTLAREKRSVLANLATQSRVFWIYVLLTILPVDLSVDRFVRISDGFSEPMVLVSVAAILILVTYAVRTRSKPTRLAVLWFGVALLPTSSLKPLLVVMNEHRTYLPLVGVAIAGGAVLATFWKGRRRFAVGALLALLGALSFFRTFDWGDDLKLWTAAVRSSPRSYQAHTNLGIEYYRQAIKGMTEEDPADVDLLRQALGEYEIAEGIFPTWFNVPFNQGLAYLAMGKSTGADEDFDLAVDRFRRCLVLSPGSFRARWHLAVVDSARGRKEEALAAFEALRAEDPSVTTIYHYPIGRLLGELERWADAEAIYRDVIDIETRTRGRPHPDARANLSLALEGQGRLDEAEAILRDLLAEMKRSIPRTLTLARFLHRTGQGEPGEAARLFHEAMMMGYRPDPDEADDILGGAPVPGGPRGRPR